MISMTAMAVLDLRPSPWAPSSGNSASTCSSDLMPKLLKLYADIATDLKRACKRSLRNFLSANGFVDDADYAFQYTRVADTDG